MSIGSRAEAGARDLAPDIVPRYRRVLLKLSGEVLAGEAGLGLDPASVDRYAREIAAVVAKGVQVGLVLGGGNFWRGRYAPQMDRPKADSMGMLATIMNGLAMQDALRRAGVGAYVYASVDVAGIVPKLDRDEARAMLQRGTVVIFAGGTGNPYFTTDTAGALRALEMQASCMIKATKVDGVYDDDPKKNPQARRFERLTYTEVLKRGLGVMDAAAISLCKDNSLPVVVCDVVTEGNLMKLLTGEDIGTVIEEDQPC